MCARCTATANEMNMISMFNINIKDRNVLECCIKQQQLRFVNHTQDLQKVQGSQWKYSGLKWRVSVYSASLPVQSIRDETYVLKTATIDFFMY